MGSGLGPTFCGGTNFPGDLDALPPIANLCTCPPSAFLTLILLAVTPLTSLAAFIFSSESSKKCTFPFPYLLTSSYNALAFLSGVGISLI